MLSRIERSYETVIRKSMDKIYKIYSLCCKEGPFQSNKNSEIYKIYENFEI